MSPRFEASVWDRVAANRSQPALLRWQGSGARCPAGGTGANGVVTPDPGLVGLALGTTNSGAEDPARLAHGARVVKAFNTTGAENMADTAYPGGAPVMLVCGDDAQARQRVMALAPMIGFEAVDMGLLVAARYLEPFAMTWIHLAFRQGFGRRFAFGLLRRDLG